MVFVWMGIDGIQVLCISVHRSYSRARGVQGYTIKGVGVEAGRWGRGEGLLMLVRTGHTRLDR